MPASRPCTAVLAGLGLLLLISAACRGPTDPGSASVATPDSDSAANAAGGGAAATAVEPIPLTMRPGFEVSRHLAGGQVEEFRLQLEAGQFLRLVIQQRGVDVVSTLLDPEAREILRVDGPTADQGSEEILALAELTGSYRLQVRAWESQVRAWESPDSGDYAIRVEELRTADAIDRRRAAAARVFSEAESLRVRGDSRALEKYQEAIGCFQALGDRSGEGNALRGIGRVYHKLPGQDQAAVDVYLEALPILREVGDVWQEAPAVHQLGQIYLERGDYAFAIVQLERALDLWQELGRSRGAAWSALELGKAHLRLGRAQKALTSFEQALAHWRDFGETPEIAMTLFQRGESFLRLGKYREALDDFERALSISQESGDHRSQMLALRSINQVYRRQGRLELALAALDRAWEPLQQIEDPSAEARLWNSTGLLHHQAERFQPALDAFEKALGGFRRIGDRTAQAVVLHNIGNTRLAIEEPCEAGSLYRDALELFDAVLGPASATYHHAKTLLYLARAERGCRGSSEARKVFERALDVLEELRSRTASLDYRSSYLATQHWFYDEYVDLLMDLHRLEPSAGHNALALAISERARARSLLDGMVESEADLRLGADPMLIRRERELAHQLQAIEQRSLSFDRTDAAADGSFDEELRSAQMRKRTLLRQLNQIQAQIHLDSPRYEALATAKTLGAGEIRNRVLDSETLLLEYDLGERRSYLWAVTPESLTSYELPAGALIERKARQVYELLKLSKRRRSMVRTEMALSELGELLLAPVAELLDGGRRLLVVSEGALQYIPFATLPLPGSTDPVLVRHEVVNMPSASAVAILREQLKDRPLAPGSLAVIADPVFQSHDPRVRAAEPLGPTDPGPGTRAELDPGRYERLVYSHQEARAAYRHLPEPKVKKLIGFESTREAVIGTDLGSYQILHFATHGVLDEQHPELSRLVLSQVDAAGFRRDNGLLFAHEIYHLDLPVELVVLSACETALGKEIRGEGLVGLTQSFFYAGAARVLVSLWNVDDYATAELMSRFYYYLIEVERRPAAALRQAQIDTWRQMPAPYYWAPFVIRGEWR